MLKQEYRLRRSAEISRARRKGERVHSPFATLQYIPRTVEEELGVTHRNVSRFCFVVSKRIGNAVARNRAKRRLREIIRLVAKDGRLADGYDCVLVAKPTVSTASYAQLEKAVHTLLTKAELLSESPA